MWVFYSYYILERECILSKSHFILFFSGSANNDQFKTAPVSEVYIKEEPIDDAVVSTADDQYHLLKREECIDIKHEPQLNEDQHIIPFLVSSRF